MQKPPLKTQIMIDEVLMAKGYFQNSYKASYSENCPAIFLLSQTAYLSAKFTKKCGVCYPVSDTALVQRIFYRLRKCDLTFGKGCIVEVLLTFRLNWNKQCREFYGKVKPDKKILKILVKNIKQWANIKVGKILVLNCTLSLFKIKYINTY